MNEYTLQSIAVGEEASFIAVVTDEKMEQFKQLSGDINPLHCDEGFACEQGFPSRVVYGMLTSAFYSTLAGMYLPGRYCLLQSVDSKMLAPVFIGDELTISGKVIEVHTEVGIIRIKAEIRNGDGKKVSKALIQAGFLPAGRTGSRV